MIDKINLTLKNYLGDMSYLYSSFEFDVRTGKNKILKINSCPNFDGFFIKIDELKKHINIELSLHKYFNFLKNGKYNNSSQFSFSDAIQTVKELETILNIDLTEANVTYYEIGLNLQVSKNPKEYLSLMQSILPDKLKKKLYVNPKIANEFCKTTEFDSNKSKVFRCYDKIEEMKKKRRNDIPKVINILRIETCHKHLRNLKLKDLLHPTYFNGLIQKFYEDWSSVEFEIIYQKKNSLLPTEIIETIKRIFLKISH